MTSGPNVIVGRPHITKRLVAGTAGPVLLFVGAASLVWRGNLLGVIFLAAGLYLVSDLWRRVSVDQGRLVAQGRVSRRGFDLSELRQVAVSPMSVVWVQANNMPAFSLRMLAESTAGDNPGLWDFPARLRAAAEAAGATPEPAPTAETTPPPAGTRPVFSW